MTHTTYTYTVESYLVMRKQLKQYNNVFSKRVWPYLIYEGRRGSVGRASDSLSIGL